MKSFSLFIYLIFALQCRFAVKYVFGGEIELETTASSKNSSLVCLKLGRGESLLLALHNNVTVYNEWLKHMDDDSCYPVKFNPSPELKPILPGQQISRGLYIKIDFSTGFKWARLDDPDTQTEPPNNDLVAIDKGSGEDPTQKHQFHYEAELGSATNASDADAKISKRINSGQKREFLELFDELASYVNDSNTSPSEHAPSKVEIILEVLDRVSHHVDYGIMFLSVPDGWSLLLNATKAQTKLPLSVRTTFATIIGNLVQNNHPVHSSAMRSNVLESLGEQLALELVNEGNFETDTLYANKTRLVSALMYSFSALARSDAGSMERCLAKACNVVPKVWLYGVRHHAYLSQKLSDDAVDLPKPQNLPTRELETLAHVSEHIAVRACNLVSDWVDKGWVSPYLQSILLDSWCAEILGQAAPLTTLTAKRSFAELLNTLSSTSGSVEDLENLSGNELDSYSQSTCVIHWNAKPSLSNNPDEL